MANKKKKSKSRLGLVIGVVVAAVLILGYVALCAVAPGEETILNNVRVLSVDVGGMTEEEAYAAISAALAEKQDTLSVDIGGNQIYFTNDVIDIDLEATTAAAVQYGHGSFFTRGASLIRSWLGKVELDPVCTVDVTAIEETIRDATSGFSSQKVEYSYTVSDNAVLITKGAAGYALDIDIVSSDIANAFLKMDLTPLKYEVEIEEPQPFSLQDVYDEVYVEPVDAAYDKETFDVIPEENGRDFDLEVAQILLDAAEAGEIVEIPLNVLVPEYTAQILQDKLFADVLGECMTYVTNNYNRNNNISLASSAINGVVLNPGDVFSFNGTVGQRTTAKGYLAAGAYVGGEVVDEVGGGICQVSSTLYLAALRGNMSIEERYCHQFTVSYVPLGMDATVNWGTLDFRFSNNTEYPVKLEMYLEGGAVTAKLWGTKEDDTWVDMTYQVLNVIPFETVEKEDETVPEGETVVDTTGSTGYVVRTYRNIYDGNDELISSEVEDTSSYSKRDKIILIPKAKEEDPEVDPGTDPGVTPTPDPGVTPTPDPGVTPDPDPTPDPGVTPDPEPTPDPDPTPDPGQVPEF